MGKLAKVINVGKDGKPKIKLEKSASQSGLFSSENDAFKSDLQFEPSSLCRRFEGSQYLRPNIDAYAQNIDGFGHQFKPIIDVNSEDGFDQIKNSIILEKAWKLELLTVSGHEFNIDEVTEPTDKEVEERIAKLKKEMMLEKWRLKSTFESFTDGTSFVDTRKQLRIDKEVTGNAYLEVRRDSSDRPAKLTYIRSATIAPIKQSGEVVLSQERYRTSPLNFQWREVERKFRKFVQGTHDGLSPTYFKEYGDPRIMSKNTGRYFKDEREWASYIKELAISDSTDSKATEVIHFAIHSPCSSSGVPRWIGCTPEILGSRAAAEINYEHFNNKSIPSMIMAISGGKLAKGGAEKLRDFVDNEIKGIRQFDKMLILEADMTPNPMAESANVPKIEFKQLQQRDDGLYQEYDKNNGKKIKAAFRNPSFLLGDTENTNFATAQTSRLFAEEQVYQPERDSFDYIINQTIMVGLDARFHTFKSNSPVMRNPELMTEIVSKLTERGILTLDEARELAEEILNVELNNVEEDWSKLPLPLTLAGFVPDGSSANMTQEELQKKSQMAAMSKAIYYAQKAKEASDSFVTAEEEKEYKEWLERIGRERINGMEE